MNKTENQEIQKSAEVLLYIPDKEDRNFITKTFDENKISYDAVSSGKILINMAIKNDYLAILVDMTPPDIDISKIPVFLNITLKKKIKPAFLFIATSVENNIINNLKNSGYDDFIHYPLVQQEILTRVQNSIKSNRLEATLGKAVKYIQSGDKSFSDLKNISNDIIIQWGKLESLGKMTSGIIHEITTPLQYISDNINFLDESFGEIFSVLKKIEDSTSDNNIKNLYQGSDMNYLNSEIPQAIKQSIDGIERITQILMSVRQLSSQNALNSRASDINEIIKNSIILTKNSWKNSCSVKMKLDQSLPKFVCKPGAISQIIVNLILNAVHALDDTGKAQNEKQILIRSFISENHIFIEVEDNANGIPKKILHKLFTPFFTTKPVEKGTGQGLSISKTIAETHGGKILVKTNEGKGSIFSIALPLQEKIQQPETYVESKNLVNETKPNKKPLLLFVDNEQDMLVSIKRTLKSKSGEWDFILVNDGKKALEIMKKQPADIIISAYFMKEMTGYELLNTIKQKYPETERIFLSGETDNNLILNTIKIANQFISKPVKAETLKDIISRTIAVRNILQNDNLKKTISQIESLPSMPSIYNEIVVELNSPHSSAKRVGEIISKDLSMTTKILQVVNSGFFYLASKISKPEDAVVILGTDIVKALVLHLEIFSKLKINPAFKKFQNSLHQHSVETAAIAQKISQAKGLSSLKSDQAFMTGLIHDCGKLILASYFPDEYKQVLKNVDENNSSFMEEEKKIFNISHCEAGAFLMGVWGIPLDTIEGILYHHMPSKSWENQFGIISAVHIANNIVCERNSDPGFSYESSYDHKFLQKLNIENDITDFRKEFIE